MREGLPQRWAISFADLGMILLGCFTMLNAINSKRAGQQDSRSEAPTPIIARIDAASIFEPGEARLTDSGREALTRIGERLSGAPVELISRGVGTGGSRLDAFELAAARTAVTARMIAQARPGNKAAPAVTLLSNQPTEDGQQIIIQRR